MYANISRKAHLQFTNGKTADIASTVNEEVILEAEKTVITQAIVVVIPAYNEAQNIEFVVRQSLYYADKVIVIDDGSTDNTATVAEAAGAIVIRHPYNQGKGVALTTGFEAASQIKPGEVVIIDGGGQHHPREIMALIKPILSGQADIIISKNIHAFSSQKFLEYCTFKQLKASIIIVTYNGKVYLRNCLSSLLIQNKYDYEIVIVDNNSADNCTSFVKKEFPLVTVILNSENGGFGRGNNIGAAYARGEFLAFLNQDTIVEPGWLESLIASLKAAPWAGLATPQILLLNDPDRINACGMDTHFTGISLNRGVRFERNTLPDLTKVGSIMGAAFVMRKGLFELLGGFDEPFFLYLEEVDLSWRARLVGYESICVPNSIIYHDYELAFGPKKTFYYERNRYCMLLKDLHWFTLLALLPALVLAEIVTWGFILVKRPQDIPNKLKAYKWVIKHWFEIMEKRQRVQATRQLSDQAFLARCTYRLDYEQTGKGLVAMLASYLVDPIFLGLYKLMQKVF